MTVDNKLYKKLQTIGKRLARTKGSKLPSLNKYFVIGESAFFTNSHVAFHFKNSLIKETLPLKDMEQNDTFPDMESFFEVLAKKKIKQSVTVSVKDMLSSARKIKKIISDRRKLVKGKLKKYNCGLLHFRLEAEELSMILGTDEKAFNFYFNNIYEILLMLEAVGEKEVTFYFPKPTKQGQIIPMLIKSESLDSVIAPIRVY